MNFATSGVLRVCGRLVCIVLFGILPVLAQSVSTPTAPASPTELDTRIRILTQSLEQTRTELSESRSEIRQLRAMLEQVLQRLGQPGTAPPLAEARSEQSGGESSGNVQQAKSNDEQNLARITQDEWQIVNARLEEQQQDKVESTLKYRLKLSGIVLFSAFGQSGRTDNLDAPTLAFPRSPGASPGSIGASLRQSIIGLTGIGPNIFGARTSGDVQADFFGGLPVGYGAATSGVMRLRVARVRLDWENTSVVAGLDAPFFSPNTPSSYMSLAVPGFATAGNLWTWTPTIRVEQRLSTGVSQFKVEAGVMDPAGFAPSDASVRTPSPGESSRQPAYSLRLSANGRNENKPSSFGVSGIYFPQRFASGTLAHGWGGVTDWRIPLQSHIELKGEFFVGKGLDAFGGVPYAWVTPQNGGTYQFATAPALAKITMIGGWSQAKIKLDARNEFNLAVGSGNHNSKGFREASLSDPAHALLWPRNQMLSANYIFRPRTDLVFSAEYRHLRTYSVSGGPAIANEVGLAAGFLF